MRNNGKKLIRYAKRKLRSEKFKEKYRKSTRHFVRKKALGFEETGTIVLKMIKKSIKGEVMDYFHRKNKEKKAPSRQAFTEAREKIRYEAFKEFFEKSCELTIESEEARKWKGYRLFGVDGTTFFVGKMEKLKGYFGESTTVVGKAMCRISAVVDIPNDCIASAKVAAYSRGERSLAIEQIEELKGVKEALYLFDRGYWSKELVGAVMRNGQKFLMRLSSNTGKTSVTDENGNEYPLRHHSLTLASGEVEVLLTNLSRDEVSDAELGALYAKRWASETKYLELKDRLQIDSFSGSSVNVVLQDIYATLYMSNLVAFTCWEADEDISERNASKNNMYDQKANRTVCIKTFRDRFVEICLLPRPADVDNALDLLLRDISSEVVYVNKSKPRPRVSRNIKPSRSANRNISPL